MGATSSQQWGLGNQPGAQRKGKPAGEQQRTKFATAEEVLGPVAAQKGLSGYMVPVGMKFYTRNKTLADPPKVRSEPFTWACKLCNQVGHEAFECTSTFTTDGKPAKSYRQMYDLQLCDVHGIYPGRQ